MVIIVYQCGFMQIYQIKAMSLNFNCDWIFWCLACRLGLMSGCK